MAWALRAGTPVSSAAAGSGSTTVAVALGAAVSLGDSIKVQAEVEDNTAAGTVVSSVTDSLGNVYTKDIGTTLVDGGSTGEGTTWTAPVTVAGTPTITVHFNQALQAAGAGGSFSAAAYSGTDTSASPVDVSVIATGNSASASSGATAATHAANELAIGGYTDDGGNTSLTAGSTWTLRASLSGDTISEQGLEDKDSGASGSTVTATLTPGAATFWTMAAIVYKLAAVGGPELRRQSQIGPRWKWLPAPGQIPLTAAPIAPVGQPLLTPLGVKGPRHSRFPFTGQVPLGGLPNPIAAADTATGADGASVQQFPDVGYRPPQPGPLFRIPLQGQIPLAGPAVVVGDTASAADAASVAQFPDVGYRPPNPGPKFRIPILGQIPLTAGGGPVAVSANDTASGADAVTLIGVTDPADIGAGADGITTIGLTGADPGTGADGVGQIGLNTTDAGVGSDGASALDLGVPTVSLILPQGFKGPRFPPAMEAQVPLGIVVVPTVPTLRDVDLIVYPPMVRWSADRPFAKWATRPPFARWAAGILAAKWRTYPPTSRWRSGPPEDKS